MIQIKKPYGQLFDEAHAKGRISKLFLLTKEIRYWKII